MGDLAFSNVTQSIGILVPTAPPPKEHPIADALDQTFNNPNSNADPKSFQLQFNLKNGGAIFSDAAFLAAFDQVKQGQFEAFRAWLKTPSNYLTSLGFSTNIKFSPNINGHLQFGIADFKSVDDWRANNYDLNFSANGSFRGRTITIGSHLSFTPRDPVTGKPIVSSSLDVQSTH
jgi:hypothetical protein